MDKPETNGALIEIEKLDVAVVFSDDGMNKILDGIQKKVLAFVLDAETEQGRQDIISLAYKVVRSKTLLDDMGKETISEWKKKTDRINKYRKTARDFLDSLKVKVREPVTLWEAEQERIKTIELKKEQDRIQARVDEFLSLHCVLPFIEVAGMSDDEYECRVIALKEGLAEEAAKFEREQKEKAEEEARMATEREEQAKKVKELEAQAATIKAAQDKIDADRKALEDEKRQEQERKDREAFEKQVAEAAKIHAEKDAKEKAEREKIEKAEAELRVKEEVERVEALKPDKDKLLSFADKLMKAKNEYIPELAYGSLAYPILSECELVIDKAIKTLTKKTKEL